MSFQSWEETLVSAQIDGTALTNTVTATSIIPPAMKYIIPANMWNIGRVMKITVLGRISNVVTAVPTITLDVRLGATIVFNGGAVACSTTVHTNVPFTWEVWLTCRAIGASANLMGQGRITGQPFLSSGADLATMGVQMTPNTAPAVGSNFDSTTALALDIFGTWSAANASNSIQTHQVIVELKN